MRSRNQLSLLLLSVLMVLGGCSGGGDDGGSGGPTGPFACSPRYAGRITWLVSVCGGGAVGRSGSATGVLNMNGCVLDMTLDQGNYQGLLTVNFNAGTARLENRITPCGGVDQGTIRSTAGSSVIIDMVPTAQAGCCTSGYVVNLTPLDQ